MNGKEGTFKLHPLGVATGIAHCQARRFVRLVGWYAKGRVERMDNVDDPKVVQHRVMATQLYGSAVPKPKTVRRSSPSLTVMWQLGASVVSSESRLLP